jgi:hypothetical protein
MFLFVTHVMVSSKWMFQKETRRFHPWDIDDRKKLQEPLLSGGHVLPILIFKVKHIQGRIS